MFLTHRRFSDYISGHLHVSGGPITFFLLQTQSIRRKSLSFSQEGDLQFSFASSSEAISGEKRKESRERERYIDKRSALGSAIFYLFTQTTPPPISATGHRLRRGSSSSLPRTTSDSV